MSSGKNLNECNGCVIINNDQNIVLPSAGRVNAYDINFEKPCFFINNHFIKPILKCYNVVLPNPVSLEIDSPADKLRIRIKIPKQVFGEKYGYDLENIVSELKQDENNFGAGLRLKSSDGCQNFTKCYGVDLDIEDYCGWITITIHHEVDKDICNLCEIGFSLCFEPVKVTTLYGECKEHTVENIELNIETCLELENPV